MGNYDDERIDEFINQHKKDEETRRNINSQKWDELKELLKSLLGVAVSAAVTAIAKVIADYFSKK